VCVPSGHPSAVRLHSVPQSAMSTSVRAESSTLRRAGRSAALWAGAGAAAAQAELVRQGRLPSRERCSGLGGLSVLSISSVALRRVHTTQGSSSIYPHTGLRCVTRCTGRAHLPATSSQPLGARMIHEFPSRLGPTKQAGGGGSTSQLSEKQPCHTMCVGMSLSVGGTIIGFDHKSSRGGWLSTYLGRIT